jgi:hypothetical protein
MATYTASASRIFGPNAASIVAPAYTTPGATTSSGSAQGLSTGAPANSAPPTSAVPVTQVLTGLQGSILGQPITWLFGLVLFLVAWKLIEERRGGAETFQKIRVDGTNTVKIGVTAMVFFIIAKFFARTVSVPGLSPLIQSA